MSYLGAASTALVPGGPGTQLDAVPERASDTAYERLRGRLVDLTYAPGAVVNELQLSRDIGLGRMPVREAVARLARERFLSVVPRRGMVVAGMGLTEVLGMLEARGIIEVGIVEQVCTKASDAELAGVGRLFDRVDEVAESADYLAFLDADHAAHVGLAELVRNPYLFPLAETLLLHNLRFWRYCHSHRLVSQGHVQPHHELTRAITARDADAAGRAIGELVTTARSGVQELF